MSPQQPLEPTELAVEDFAPLSDEAVEPEPVDLALIDDLSVDDLAARALDVEEPAALPETHSPALERLGAEGLARLRARCAEVMARISERELDEATKEQLKLQAERLNPDTWLTAAEVAEGLEQYETVFESLRAVVGSGHRRRRRRR